MRKGTAIGLALALVAALGLLIWLLDDDPAAPQATEVQAAHSTPAPENDCLGELELASQATDGVQTPLDVRSTACSALGDVQGLLGTVEDRIDRTRTGPTTLTEA